MQKKVSATVRAFGRAHKAGLALLGGGVAALGVFWAARRNAAAMQWWVEYVSMPVKRFVSALVEPLPFSFCELAATAAILICLVRLVQRIVRAMHRKQAGFAAWVLHVGTAAVAYDVLSIRDIVKYPIDKSAAVQSIGSICVGGGVAVRPYLGELAPAGVPADHQGLHSDR